VDKIQDIIKINNNFKVKYMTKDFDSKSRTTKKPTSENQSPKLENIDTSENQILWLQRMVGNQKTLAYLQRQTPHITPMNRRMVQRDLQKWTQWAATNSGAIGDNHEIVFGNGLYTINQSLEVSEAYLEDNLANDLTKLKDVFILTKALKDNAFNLTQLTQDQQKRVKQLLLCFVLWQQRLEMMVTHKQCVLLC
jgi:hypothetical protein